MGRTNVRNQLRTFWAARAAQLDPEKAKAWEQDHLRVATWMGGGA
jgi:hypothetical protein